MDKKITTIVWAIVALLAGVASFWTTIFPPDVDEAPETSWKSVWDIQQGGDQTVEGGWDASQTNTMSF